MPIETLAIGDEILAGKISDTNSTEVANGLFAQGRRLVRQTVIPGASSYLLKEILMVIRNGPAD